MDDKNKPAPPVETVAKQEPPKPDTKKSLDDLVKDIKQQKTPPESKPAVPKVAEPAADPTREAMLAHLAKEYNTTPDAVAKMLQVGEPAANVASPVLVTPDPGGKRIPVLLKRDYWAPDYLGEVNADGNRRVAAGAVLHVPIPEAKRLIASGVAERADAFPED